MKNLALTAAIVGAISGALASFIVNLCVTRWRLWKLYRNLKFEPQPLAGKRGTARIHNGYIFPINSAFAYITINHDLNDVLPPPTSNGAYISPSHFIQVKEDRLCWSVTMPEPNPPNVDIYPGERQLLDIVNIDPAGVWIEFPSERGWATMGRGPSRVFLKAKKYTATVKIVSKDAKAKEFKIEIDPILGDPIKLIG